MHSSPTYIRHFIDGKPLDGLSGRTQDVTNPASGKVALGAKADVDAAVAAAQAAFPAWVRTPSVEESRLSSLTLAKLGCDEDVL